jgi:hypothetical protein
MQQNSLGYFYLATNPDSYRDESTLIKNIRVNLPAGRQVREIS